MSDRDRQSTAADLGPLNDTPLGLAMPLPEGEADWTEDELVGLRRVRDNLSAIIARAEKALARRGAK